ncbi:MAG: ACP S-malonyltransferase [Planctomycetota bacterium]
MPKSEGSQRPTATHWPGAALAFRGYNTTNLGRTAELLAVPAYRSLVQRRLQQAGRLCGEVIGRPVDLVARVQQGREAPLEEYAEAVALVFAAELAQLDLLRECHQIDPRSVVASFGYSLGELAALSAAGVLVDDEALRIPLAMATDCARLADGVTMGILFSRQQPVPAGDVLQLCDEITQRGDGVIGVSAVLSPNSVLVLGQGDTIHALRRRVPEALPGRVHLRLNDSRWPPLHTPIVWQSSIVDRASVMIQRLAISPDPPERPVVSLVSGCPVGGGAGVRTLLRNWVDHPQRLWDAVCWVLRSPTQTVIHIGPAPNVIPATFSRLSENVRGILSRWDLSGLGARAMEPVAYRQWLASRLPTSAALLRAPQIKHVVLEDWLIDNAPG